MVSKVMKVFYGGNCLPYKDKERSVLYPIIGGAFMGASNTTEVRFYIDEIGGIDSSWVCISKLPNGKTGTEVLLVGYDSEIQENYVYLQLTTFYTQAKGELYLTLAGYQGGITYEYDDDTGLYTISGTPTIEATGSVKINIAYATLLSGSDELQFITLQNVLALVGDKLNKSSNYYLKVVDSVANVNTAKYEEYLYTTDVILDSDTFKVYTLSGTYPSLVATFVCDLNENGIISLASISNGTILTGEQLFEANKKDSVCFYDNKVYQKVSGGTYNTFASILTLTNNNGLLTASRTLFKVNSSTGLISDSHTETYNFYDNAESDSLLNNLSIQVDNKLDLKADKSTTYTKSETNTLLNDKQDKLIAGSGIVINGRVISSTGAISLQVVNSLPQTGINGVIYLLANDQTEQNNIYDEYIWNYINNTFEKIGSTAVDLTDYATKQWVADQNYLTSIDYITSDDIDDLWAGE